MPNTSHKSQVCPTTQSHKTHQKKGGTATANLTTTSTFTYRWQMLLTISSIASTSAKSALESCQWQPMCQTLFHSAAKWDSCYDPHVAFVFNTACQLLRLASPIANARTTSIPDCENQRNGKQRGASRSRQWCAGANRSGFHGLKKGWLLWGKGPWHVASSTPVYCSRIIRVLKGGRRLSFWKAGNATMQKWRRRKTGGERRNAHNSSEQDWAPGILTELFQQNRSGQTVLQAHAIGKITSLHRLRVEKENTKK